MAPRPKRISRLGEALRAAREALAFDQPDLAGRVFTSTRQLSRWENGTMPPPRKAQLLLDVLSAAPAAHVAALADALGIELPEVTAEPPPATAPLPPPPAAPVPRPASELRAAFDAIVYAAAEEHDLLPRRLRAFAVDLLRGVDRLGVSAKDAAVLVAMAERGDGSIPAHTSTSSLPLK
jgi:transcriptional regulator with XRE-family HTH domain